MDVHQILDASTNPPPFESAAPTSSAVLDRGGGARYGRTVRLEYSAPNRLNKHNIVLVSLDFQFRFVSTRRVASFPLSLLASPISRYSTESCVSDLQPLKPLKIYLSLIMPAFVSFRSSLSQSLAPSSSLSSAFLVVLSLIYFRIVSWTHIFLAFLSQSQSQSLLRFSIFLSLYILQLPRLYLRFFSCFQPTFLPT